MDIYAQLVEKIIREQETIIGPVALEQANKVQGLKINWPKHEVSIEGNEKEIIEKLVAQYEHLFGRASVELCREAVKDIISKATKDQVPQVLL